MVGTVDDWIIYAGQRGFDQPSTASLADASAALVRGSDYILYRYVANFLPQYDETLPIVESAVYEAALIELLSPNAFNSSLKFGDKKTLIQVDTIRWQVSYNSDKTDDPFSTVSTKIENMLRPYVAWQKGPFYGLRALGG